MPYRKQDWASQTKIPKSSMIAMDEQIADNDSRITSHTTRLTAVEATASEANTKATTANTTISGIVNGTTPAGSATKLNGKPASDYATTATVTALADDVSVSKAELVVLGWNVPSGMTLKNTVENGVFTQKVGRIDLGSLSWVKAGTDYYSAVLTPTMKRTSGKPVVANMFSSLPIRSQSTFENVEDGLAYYYTASTETSSRLVIHNSTVSDASALTNHLKGIYLYYELATPITHNITDMPSQKSMISDEWDSAKTYSVGAYAIYQNRLYKCLIQNSGQNPSTATSYWQMVKVTDIFGSGGGGVGTWSKVGTTSARNHFTVNFSQYNEYLVTTAWDHNTFSWILNQDMFRSNLEKYLAGGGQYLVAIYTQNNEVWLLDYLVNNANKYSETGLTVYAR